MNKEEKTTIKALGFASFFNDLGSDMIFPLWPLFVTVTLKGSMSVLGLLDGIGNFMVYVAKGLSGYISDKIRRRKVFIWTGYLAGMVSRIGYAVATSWIHLIPARILDRAGKVRSAPRDAIVNDISTKETRGKNFGFLRQMDHLGAFLGIIIGILLFQYLSLKTIFLIAALPGAISVGLVIFYVKESFKNETNVVDRKEPRRIKFSFQFKLFLIFSLLFNLSSFSYSFLLLFAKQSGFSIKTVPVFYLVFTGIAFFAAPIGGRLTGTFGRVKTVLIGVFLWILTLVSIIIFIDEKYFITIVFVLYGLFKGIFEVAEKTVVAELSPTFFKATGIGFYQMISGLMLLPSSLVAGILWDNLGIFAPVYFSLFLSICSLLPLLMLQKRSELLTKA